MKRAAWPVTADDVRQEDRPGLVKRCSHCAAPKGEEHYAKCVKRKRSVVVRTVIEHTILVPEDWDAGMVEFHRDGSSWCASNVADELVELAKRGCICGQMTAEFEREATAEDEARDGVTVGGDA